MPNFYTLPTALGEAKIANAIALGTQVNISELAVGDGGGSLPTPDSDRTTLVNELRRAPINRIEVDDENPNWIVVEQILPPDVGGWTVRELGLLDDDGNLIAYGNYPETYKPVLSEGSGRTQTIRFVMLVSDTAAVTLKVDPSVVLATRQYVDKIKKEHEEAEKAHTDSQISISEEIPQALGATRVSSALAALGTFSTNNYQNITIFDTTGITHWDVPDILRRGLRKAWIRVEGGGASGGSNENSGGGGGGAGGVAEGLVDLTAVDIVPVTIGTGGSAVSTSSNGYSGGTSSFGAFMSATGGEPGLLSGTAGNSGLGVGGDINHTQPPASGGIAITTSAGATSNRGGDGGGCGGRGGTGSGQNATSHGGGGGGGRHESGAGFRGKIIVRW